MTISYAELRGLGEAPWGYRHEPSLQLASCLRTMLCRPRAFCCPGGLEPVCDPRLPPFQPPPRLPPLRRPPRLPPPREPTRLPPPRREPPPFLDQRPPPYVEVPPFIQPPGGFVPQAQLLQRGGLVEVPGGRVPGQQILTTPGAITSQYLPGVPPAGVVTAWPAAPVTYTSFPQGPPAASAAATQPPWLATPGPVDSRMISSPEQLVAALPQAVSPRGQRAVATIRPPVSQQAQHGVPSGFLAPVASAVAGLGRMFGLGGNNTRGLDRALAEARAARAGLVRARRMGRAW